jgi:uncharacterized protein YcbK (DUF882 family)
MLAGLMLAITLTVGGAMGASTSPRFFFAGDGRLVLRHAYFDTTLDVRYRHADATYDPAALAQISHFFRSREDGREAPISLRLVELLAYIQDHYHPRQMILLSGYRSPEFNADLRAAGPGVAQTSLHTQALAADILFQGLDMGRLWRQLRTQRVGGVGYYRKNNFLHVDTGPPRFWEATTSRVDENLSAGNGRVFLRTDFDRYDRIDGALCSLYSVTAFPLRIAPQAQLVTPRGSMPLTIEPAAGHIESRDGCFAITTPAEAYQFRIVTAQAGMGFLYRVGAGEGEPARVAPPVAPDSRSHVVLSTCEPRIERTAPAIESNPIEAPPP